MVRNLMKKVPTLTGKTGIARLASKGKPTLTKLDVKPPPAMAWLLVGIPTARFGEIAPIVEQLSEVKDIVMETAVNDG